MNHPSDLTSGSNLLIKIIGIGGAGVHVMDHVMRRVSGDIPCALVHTNARVLDRSSCPQRLLIGTRLLRGFGAGGDPDLGKAAAEADLARMRELCAGADLVLLVAGMGGGTATGAAPVIARLAKESGALVLGLVALPFDFEGPRRQRQARAGLIQLRGVADGVVCLPNQKVGRILDEDTRALEVFNHINELWADGVHGILQLLTQHGLINVDFADLAAVLRGRHSESCFASVEASGETRSREIIESILGHPLLDSGNALVEADAVLVALVGGPDLTMADVTRVMDQLRRQSDNAQMVMGASIREELAGKLRVTIIASRHGQESVDDEGAPPDVGKEGAFAHAGPAQGELPVPVALTQDADVRREGGDSDSAAVKRMPPALDAAAKTGRVKKSGPRLRQGQLPLEIVSKGRFEKSQPTIHRGEDLDVPTYLRRGIKLN